MKNTVVVGSNPIFSTNREIDDLNTSWDGSKIEDVVDNKIDHDVSFLSKA